jgi:hypothetical protein
VLFSNNLTLGNDGSLSRHHVSNLSSVLDSTQHGFSLELFFELLEFNLLNVISLLVFLEDILHSASSLNFTLFIRGSSSLFSGKLSVDFQRFKLDVGVGNFTFTLHFIFRIIKFFVLVSCKGQTDEDEKEHEGQPGLCWRNLGVSDANEQPDVSE